jgi:exodeoxyribonuclease VII large subunit
MNEELTKISNLRDRADRRINDLVVLEMTKIAGLMQRPVMREPMIMVTSREEIIKGIRIRGWRSMDSAISHAKSEIKQITARVRTLSPQATLDRGYSVVQKSDGRVVRKASEIKSGEKLRLRLAQGEVGAITE